MFALGTWCITVMFPKFQMPDEILKSCTVSYYSSIYGANGAFSLCAQYLSISPKLLDSANNSIFLMYMYTELMQQNTMVAEVKE